MGVISMGNMKKNLNFEIFLAKLPPEMVPIDPLLNLLNQSKTI